jgi:uncharacterized coiled-coil protein SlyX
MKKSDIDLGKIPMTAKAKKGMNLSSDDIQYMKRMMDLTVDAQNESYEAFALDFKDAFDKNIFALTTELAKVIQEQNIKMLTTLEEQTKSIERIGKNVDRVIGRLDEIEKRLDGIETSLGDKENRLKDLEKYASFKQTLIRHTVAAIIWLSIGLGLGYYLHSFIPQIIK